jgi:aquaporin Z
MLQVASGQPKTAPGILFVAPALGLAPFVFSLIVGRISGALINPAIALSLASAGRLPRGQILPYLAAPVGGPLLGATAAVWLYKYLVTQSADEPRPE